MGAAKTSYIVEGASEPSGGRSFSIPGLLGKAAFYGMLAVVLLAAFPNGTVDVWYKAAVISAIAFVALIRIVAGLSEGSFRIAEPGLLFPMAGVILVAVVQSTPSPITGGVISLDPYETRAFILVLGSLIVCAEVIFTFATTPARLKDLAILVITVAAGSSLFGFLWEVLDGSDYNIFASYVRPHQGYAQFINRNHFALSIEMAVGLLIGLLLKARLDEKQRFFGWLLAGGLIYSLIAAGSRGGLVSLVGLVVFAIFLHVFARRSKRSEAIDIRWLGRSTGARLAAVCGICLLVVVLIVFMAAFVGGDRLASRFERVESEVAAIDTTRTNRKLIWASTIDMIAAKPIWGVGFGAYETAITSYDRSNGAAALKQAHNEYLEVLSNGGVVGTLPVLAFAFLAFIRIKTNLASADPERSAYTFGATVGIFGVMVHSLVDFGLHVMVNSLLFVVVIIIAAAKVTGPQSNKRRRNAKRRLVTN